MNLSTQRLSLISMFIAAAAAATGCGGGDATPAPSPAPAPAPAPSPTAQTINFTSPGAQTLGVTPAALSATASSNLAVTFTSTTPTVCTVSGTTLTLVSAGDCEIDATQAGDATYAAASVSRTFAVSTLKFSTGFATGGLTVQGGSYGGYSGSDIQNWNCSAGPAECGDFTDTTANLPAADTYAGRYNQTTVAKGGEYVGVYVQAPGVAGVNLGGTATDVAGLQVTGQTKMSFTFNQNPEWYNGSANNFYVLLTMGKGYAGNCRVQLHQVLTPTSVDATRYTVNLADFAVAQDCGDATMDTVQEALANSTIAQVDVQGLGGTSAKTVNGKTSGSNLTVATGNGVIPTTVVLKGEIDFQ